MYNTSNNFVLKIFLIEEKDVFKLFILTLCMKLNEIIIRY